MTWLITGPETSQTAAGSPPGVWLCRTRRAQAWPGSNSAAATEIFVHIHAFPPTSVSIRTRGDGSALVRPMFINANEALGANSGPFKQTVVKQITHAHSSFQQFSVDLRGLYGKVPAMKASISRRTGLDPVRTALIYLNADTWHRRQWVGSGIPGLRENRPLRDFL